MSVASSGSTDPVQELETLRELRALLLDLCESPASQAAPPAVPPSLVGRTPRDRVQAPSPDTRGPGVKSVLASLSTLGAALERVGEGDAHSSSWRALETLQGVVEQWLGGAGALSPPSPPPPRPSRKSAESAGAHREPEASRYYRRAEDDLRRLGSLKVLPSQVLLGPDPPGEADSADPEGNGDVPPSARTGEDD